MTQIDIKLKALDLAFKLAQLAINIPLEERATKIVQVAEIFETYLTDETFTHVLLNDLRLK